MALMPSPVFRWFVPAQSGVGLVPAARYKAKFYAAGTADPKTIYINSILTTPYPSPANVAVLNPQGFALIYLASGAYKLVVTDSNDNPVYVQDNITGDGSFGTGFVSNWADLAAVNTSLNKFVYMAGYYNPGDGGQGMFYNATSSTPDDGGYIRRSTFDNNIDWFRIPDEDGDVRAASFGFIPSSGTEQTAQLQAADAYAASVGARLRIEAGSDAQINPIILSAPYVVFNAGAQLKGVIAVPDVAFNGIVIAENEQIFNRMTVTLSANQNDAIAEWFGATLDNPDNKTAFDALWASGAGGFKINPGTWNVASSTPPTNKLILSYGILYDGVNEIVPIGFYYLVVKNLLVDGPLAVAGVSTLGGVVNALNAMNVTGAIAGASTVTAGTGITSTTGNIVATAGQLIAGTSIIAGTTVFAGSWVKATAGIQTFKSSGRIASLTGAGTPTLLGGTLVNAGDSIVITAQGTFSPGGGTSVTYACKIGTVGFSKTQNSQNPTAYRFVVTFIVTGTNTVAYSGVLYLDNDTVSGSSSIVLFNNGTGSPTLSGDLTIAATVSAGTPSQNLLTVELYPA